MQALLFRRGVRPASTTAIAGRPGPLVAVAARCRRPPVGAGAAGPASPASPWQPVVDAATQKAYWWNRDTNVTQWEDPAPVSAAPAAAAPAAAAQAAAAPGRGAFGGGASASAAANGQGAPRPSREELLAALVEAMGADGSGMAFWEAARERRADGVFEDAYIDWLSAAVARGGEAGETAGRVRARLVNPLLRQAAPFE